MLNLIFILCFAIANVSGYTFRYEYHFSTVKMDHDEAYIYCSSRAHGWTLAYPEHKEEYKYFPKNDGIFWVAVRNAGKKGWAVGPEYHDASYLHWGPEEPSENRPRGAWRGDIKAFVTRFKESRYRAFCMRKKDDGISLFGDYNIEYDYRLSTATFTFWEARKYCERSTQGFGWIHAYPTSRKQMLSFPSYPDIPYVFMDVFRCTVGNSMQWCMGKNKLVNDQFLKFDPGYDYYNPESVIALHVRRKLLQVSHVWKKFHVLCMKPKLDKLFEYFETDKRQNFMNARLRCIRHGQGWQLAFPTSKGHFEQFPRSDKGKWLRLDIVRCPYRQEFACLPDGTQLKDIPIKRVFYGEFTGVYNPKNLNLEGIDPNDERLSLCMKAKF